MSGFWNPAKMSEEKQFELDKRVILGIAKDKLQRDLEKVNKKMKTHRENYLKVDVFSMTRKRRAALNTRADNLAFERNEIERRLEIIKEEEKY